jgi:hypothetical protein
MCCNFVLLDSCDRGYQRRSLEYICLIIIVLTVEKAAVTLIHGEQAFKEGNNSITEAIENYRKCRDDLTHSIIVDIHQGMGYYSHFSDSSSTEEGIL